jgi:hypothetical protein
VTDDELIGVLDRLCDALVEPAYRSALAYRERDGSTVLGRRQNMPRRQPRAPNARPIIRVHDVRCECPQPPASSGAPVARCITT